MTPHSRVRRPIALAAVTAVAIALGAQPVAATSVEAPQLTLEAVGGTTFQIGPFRYGGPIELTAFAEGIAVVETVELDGYLAGIREVPFSWPSEALAAQAVAARTYLAWTLVRGRIGDQNRYAYDICATVQCQVYVGAGAAQLADGERWLAAVEHTTGEILVHDGTPAQALYSSSAGSRTRANQDIWGGTPKPYLQAVDSPEEGVTPYSSWTVEFPTDVFGRIVRHAGFDIGGSISTISLDAQPEGSGPSRVLVTSEEGVASIAVDRFRAIFNIYGPKLYPGQYPARRATTGRWPQTVLSYTFGIEFDPGRADVAIAARQYLPRADLPEAGSVTVSGEGWGHGIGMSQWGAKAMADAGAGYGDILGHYYGGLTPTPGGAMVPESVRVGLAVEQAAVRVIADGPFRVLIDGIPAGTLVAGDWSFPLTNRGIGVVAEFDLPPGIIEVLGRLRPR